MTQWINIPSGSTTKERRVLESLNCAIQAGSDAMLVQDRKASAIVFVSLCNDIGEVVQSIAVGYNRGVPVPLLMPLEDFERAVHRTWEASRDAEGDSWQGLVITVDANSADLTTEFFYGLDAEALRVDDEASWHRVAAMVSPHHD